MFRLVVLALFGAVGAVDFVIQNKAGGMVWVGIQGNPGYPHLENGGFQLNRGQSRTVRAPEKWEGRIWPRTWCDPKTKHCLTGDCGNKLQCAGAGGVPPASLAEIKLKGNSGLDNYDVSLVDGFNIPIAFWPVNGKADGSRLSCKRASCDKNLNSSCPGPLRLNSAHGVIGCKSACLAFNNDEYCCRGAFNSSKKCKASGYANFFKSNCPMAYSYAYNDDKSLMTCKAQKYMITFM
ncbi:unnamed protein product [Acanthoscelides obtectus]|uniref:Thaumatin-like protein n=1 Tax=Acanthoscelides obtectus TaxID=200917 RepID=A0A9P0JJT6_ACAOB|nr:unnamed protein product [Acanthoscelides obtectus]CAK1678499.1 Pathogenesis-related protein 5 [Acanthoscelides obtectus]